MKTPAEIDAEIKRIEELPVGPNQRMYVRGAIQALVWMRDNAIPPSNVFDAVCTKEGIKR